MASVAAQFRLSNPVLDEAMKRTMKRSQDRIDQTDKITRSGAAANLAMEAMIRNGTAPTDPALRQRLLADMQSAFMGMKSADELLGEQLKRENAIQDLFVTEDDVNRWGLDMAPIVRNRLQEQAIERRERRSSGKSTAANFMNPMNLMSNYMRFVGFEEEMLRLPMPGVPVLELDEESLGSAIIQQEAALELTQGIAETARILAMDRFAKWVEQEVGVKFVERAIDSLGFVQPVQQLNDLIEQGGPLDGARYKDIRDLERGEAVKDMRRNLDAQMQMRFESDKNRPQNTP